MHWTGPTPFWGPLFPRLLLFPSFSTSLQGRCWLLLAITCAFAAYISRMIIYIIGGKSEAKQETVGRPWSHIFAARESSKPLPRLSGRARDRSKTEKLRGIPPLSMRNANIGILSTNNIICRNRERVDIARLSECLDDTEQSFNALITELS